MKKEKKTRLPKTALAVCNIVLILAAVLFTAWYSDNVRTSQEELLQENFCNTVDSMRQISVRYLTGELSSAEGWGDYIERQHMTMPQALDYIRTVSAQEDCEAHFVDMDTMQAWSTNTVNGSNSVDIYAKYAAADTDREQEYIARMHKMFEGRKCVLGRYTLRESLRHVISVGLRVTLREADGSDKDYLLLRVVPVDRMKELWLFPVSYSTAQIGLIGTNGDYMIPSEAMRAGNFLEFVRSYSFPDDYSGAEKELAQLQTQDRGLMELNDSRGRKCLWYYSRLNEFEGLDILGYIPADDLFDIETDLSIVIVVVGLLLLLALIDGAYILKINSRLRRTAEIAEKASNAKTEFLSSMSHDIRTPLNAVLGMTELAQNHIDDNHYVQECLRKISVSGSHLLTLINDILEISRVESGRTSINPAPFAVQELVSGLESITRSQVAGRGLHFEVQVRELPEPVLLGDKLRLTQIYLNLLNNAVKYTDPGGNIRLEVWEETADAGRVELVCVIADTGTGMSEAFQKDMYESFTRVADSRVDKTQGSGLGLAIVKRMVTLMDGTIACESQEGVGTTFTVRIPLTAAAEPVQQKNAPAESLQNSDLTGLHILVAEDNDLNWEIISELLLGYGIHCDRAENGQECVDMLQKAAPNTYQMVFMDVQMPLLNGRDAARALRASDREDLRRIPIAAMTADAFAEDVQMCREAGMNAHIAKPVEMDKVLTVIRLLLSGTDGTDGDCNTKRGE